MLVTRLVRHYCRNSQKSWIMQGNFNRKHEWSYVFSSVSWHILENETFLRYIRLNPAVSKVDVVLNVIGPKSEAHLAKARNWNSNKPILFTSTEMKRKVTLLILTDGLCWIPICIMFFFSQVGGQPLFDSAYIITACTLLPVNSALNPLIYSQCGVRSLKYFNFRFFGAPAHLFNRKQVAKVKRPGLHIVDGKYRLN